MATARTFDKWKAFLADKVNTAQASGISEEALGDLAYQIGRFLNDKIDPQNPEEQLLKLLWDVGTPEEQHTLARLMVKLVDER
jgi:Protein of unknown function (DUF3243)